MKHHKDGRTQLDNIHHRRNLLALCHICHWAFDSEQWCFLPEHLTAWLQDIQASPERILHYNTLENVKWKRLLLEPDPQSIAMQDAYFRAAFDDMPVKHWPGEAGAVIIRNASIISATSSTMDTETKNAIRDYRALLNIWSEYQHPCTLLICKICIPPVQEEMDDIDEDNGDTEEDEEEKKDKNDSDEKDDENEDEGHEDEEDADSKAKNKKTLFGRQGKKARMPGRAKKIVKAHVGRYGRRASIAKRTDKPKRRKGQERDWLTTEPYDESVPYSHRYGYTYAHATSNDRIRYWCMGHGLPFEPPEPPAYVKAL